jgi:hypothetical protein
VACMTEDTKVFKILVVNPEENRPLGRLKRRWGRMDSKWILGRLAGGCGLDSLGLR